MAKRKGLNAGREHGQPTPEARLPEGSRADTTLLSTAGMLNAAGALVAAGVVYAGYWPADSIAVQAGAARYLIGLLILAATLAMIASPQLLQPARGDEPSGAARQRLDTAAVVELAAWAVAIWMGLSLGANADQANLRLGVNEGWWWVAAAATVSATRRCGYPIAVATAWLRILGGVGVGVAVYGWHQLFIGFPAMRAEYRRDPEGMLRGAGFDADPGSAQRILFENRLNDGGPTGTFALANSMAALLLAVVIVMLGLLIHDWRHSGRSRRGFLIAMLAIVAGMLLAARSRSAVASLLVVGALWLGQRLLATVGGHGGGAFRGQRSAVRRSLISIGCLGGMLLAGGWFVVRLANNSEWVSQAPASLAFRLRYWAASWQMLSEQPWFGVGPGQFKARYESYRVAESVEQIADPHNWFWQVVTTGGLPAGCLLVGVGIATAGWCLRRRATASKDCPGESPWAEAAPRAVYLGGAVAVGLIWVLGGLLGYLPSLDAGLVGTILGAGYVWAATVPPRSDAPTDSTAPRSAAALRSAVGWAAVAVAIDLLFAGGLTVPGVALPCWVLVGVLIARPAVGAAESPEAKGSEARGDGPGASDRLSRIILGLSGVLLLACWYLTAVLPLERAAGPLGRFALDWEQGQYGAAESSLRRAMEADRWDPEPAILSADLAVQLALFEPSRRQAWEASWREAEAEALRRAGPDPVTIRRLADNHIWHYQRYGDAAALLSAAELYRRAIELAPAHEAYAAQLAEIYFELDDPRAGELLLQAERLSESGGLFERTFPYLRLMPARSQGLDEARDRLRRTASELFAERQPAPPVGS